MQKERKRTKMRMKGGTPVYPKGKTSFLEKEEPFRDSNYTELYIHKSE
jgi:hypothetical protein